MTTHRLLSLSLSVLIVACGDKDTTTEPATEPATSGAQTTTGDTTAAEAGTTVEAPTTGDATTGAVGTTTYEPMTTSDPMTTTGDTTGCSGDCGVVIEMASSMCDEQNPDMVPPSLVAEANGPGAIKVTEMGFETSCCLELSPGAYIEDMTLFISYAEVGEPCDCICYYTIDYVISGLASGTWTVESGAQSVDVEVP